MGNYFDDSFNTGVNIPNYLSTLSSRIAKVSDTEISIDSKCNMTFRWSGNTLNVTIVSNGSTIFTGAGGYDYYPQPLVHIFTVISDNLIYFHIYRNTTGGDTGTRDFVIAYVTDGNNNYFAGGTYYNGVRDIHDINCYNLDTLASGYVFPKTINFAAPAGSILYSSLAPFSNGGSFAFFAKDLYSCSTVSRGSTIALPNGKVFISIGTNAMVEITQ